MTQYFNYKEFACSPSTEEEAAAFKQSVGWDSLSPHEQNSIRREITRDVTDQVHQKVKDLREHVHASMKVSGLDEKSELARIMNFVRELDLLIQGGRQA